MKRPIPFGKYYLMERVAVGGMAEVFKGKHFGVEKFEKTVALKRILPNIAEDNEFITMFIDEANIAVQLTHANIAQIYELGEEQGTYFIAMEYVQGKDLRTIFDRLRRTNTKTLLPAQAAYVMARVCAGLDYAHRKTDRHGTPLNIVHRDVSPQNVLLSYEGDVKVIDFGVAKAQNKMGKTQAGILKGKFAYMSPEQVSGLPIDHRSDIFSVGIVFHEILTGQRLFVGESDFHTLEKIRTAEADPPSTINPAITPELDGIVMRALARDVNARYQNTSEMHDDLQRYLYTQTPVFAQKDLASFMQKMFTKDINKEKNRAAEYDQFFQQHGAPDIPVGLEQTPTGGSSWPNNGKGSFPGPGQANQIGSYSGSVPNPHVAQQASNSYNAPTPPAPAFTAAPAAQSSPFPPPAPSGGGLFGSNPAPVAQQSGGYFQDDIGESTMLDPNAALPTSGLFAPAAPNPSAFQSPFSPGSPSAFGDAPTAALDVEDAYAALGEEETATIIDVPVEDAPQSSGGGANKGLIFGVVGALAFIVLGAVAFFIYKGRNVKPPPPEEVSRIELKLRPSLKGVRFLLNKMPLPPKQVKKLGPNKVALITYKEGSFELQVRKKGHRPFVYPWRASSGSMYTMRIRLRPASIRVPIKTTPVGATVFFNGRKQRQRTPASYRLPTGKQIIRVMKQGYAPWIKTVTIGNRTRRISMPTIEMKKTKATLKLLCKSGKAKLVIYKQRGKRWRRWKRSRTPWSYSKLDPFKSYRVDIKPKKFKPQSLQISFGLDPVKTLALDCEPPKPEAILSVTSPIKGAKVYANKKLLGTTPLKKGIKPGNYTIVIRHPKSNKAYNVGLKALKVGKLHNVYVPASQLK